MKKKGRIIREKGGRRKRREERRADTLLHPTLQIHLREPAAPFLVRAARAPEAEEVVFDDGFAFAWFVVPH